MQIKIIPATGPAIVLGDDDQAVAKYIFDYRGELPSRIQPVLFFRAEFPSNIIRGYEMPFRSFKVDQVFAAPGDAFTFSETQPESVPLSGTLVIIDNLVSIQFAAIREIARPVLRSGCTVIMEYKFQVGSAQLTPPAS